MFVRTFKNYMPLKFKGNLKEISEIDNLQRGGLTVYEIYIGFCPRTNFYNIMHIACLVHGHFISNLDFLLST